MANKTIPQLPNASSIDDNTLLPIDSGTQTFKTTALQLKNYNNQEIKDSVDNILLPLTENLLTKNFSKISTYDYLKQIVFNPNFHQILGVRSTIVGSTDRLVGKSQNLSNQVPFVPTSSDNADAKIWQAGCYSNALNLYVIVGMYSSNQNSIATNPGDLFANWTLRSANTNENLRGVAWSESLGLFVAAGTNGTILTSTNGIAWTSRTSGVSDDLGSVAWSESLGLFAIVNMESTSSILTSPDGISWTQRSVVLAAQGDHRLKFLKNLFVISGSDLSDVFLTSPDGISWTQRSVNVGVNVDVTDITYCEKLDLFFAALYLSDGPPYGTAVAKSKDLVNWEYDYIDTTGDSPSCIEYIEGVGLIVGGAENSDTYQSITI